jgi:hypothetical protein
MAKRTIVVSDLNGEEVDDSASATVTVSWAGRENQRVLEITAQEADELFGEAGVERKRRGRKAADATPAPAAETPAAPAETTKKK